MKREIFINLRNAEKTSFPLLELRGSNASSQSVARYMMVQWPVGHALPLVNPTTNLSLNGTENVVCMFVADNNAKVS